MNLYTQALTLHKIRTPNTGSFCCWMGRLRCNWWRRRSTSVHDRIGCRLRCLLGRAPCWSRVVPCIPAGFQHTPHHFPRLRGSTAQCHGGEQPSASGMTRCHPFFRGPSRLLGLAVKAPVTHALSRLAPSCHSRHITSTFHSAQRRVLELPRRL